VLGCYQALDPAVASGDTESAEAAVRGPTSNTSSTMHALSAMTPNRLRVSRATIWSLTACIAVAVPTLVARHIPPMPSFLNQALALFGWGALLALFAGALPANPAPWPRGVKALLLALLALVTSTLATPWWTGQPISLALGAAGMICAAALAATYGAALQQTAYGALAFRALCVGILVAAMAHAFIAAAQIYAPSLIDGQWLAAAGDGRATGNLRQSNHLCTMSLWGIVAVIWLGETRVLRRVAVSLISILLVFSVVLTASRSGALGALILAIWGLVDRRLTRQARVTLILAPFAYALLWVGAAAIAQHVNLAFAGEERFTFANARLSTRFDVWPNTLDLIRAHPWFGVGVGEFNLAWSLTPFPIRSGELFNHSHNLLLEFLVELGLPVGTLVITLLGWACWAAVRNCRHTVESVGSSSHLRPAFAMVSLVVFHSMLEFPFGYAYFLLPAAFVLGLCLAPPIHGVQASPQPARPRETASHFRPAALIMMFGAAFSLFDYLRVVPIFVPPPPYIDSPLSERIAAGQRSLLFPYLADLPAAVLSADPNGGLAASRRAAHNLLDSNLMIALANRLHATGDTDRAKYVAQRLLEFDTPQYPVADTKAYFAPCKDPALKDADRPYQCFPPQRKFTFEDFR
jgi:O-antigen ligase